MTILKGVIYITCACILSCLLSVSADTSKHEPGAMLNYVWPPFLAVLAIIVFMITCWISKKTTVRKITVSVLSIYIVYVGLALHFDKDYWPLVIW
jgi:glucan phosphoethanolaminetransferase (alkaline phosphatase superfamily)